VMIIAQFFCIMPLCGILNSNINRLKFQWLSVRTILALILICFGFIELGTIFHVFTGTNNTLGAFGKIIQYYFSKKIVFNE